MKKNFTIIIFFWGFAFLGFYPCLSRSATPEYSNFNSNPKNYNVKLQIFANNKEIANFMVAIANNNKTREYGLMNLENLNQGHGMLFLFDKNQVINMWMKNTLIALDMIFIDENNIIVNIKEHAEPRSLSIISSQKPVKKVLEINAGLSKKLAIKTGQKIIYENF